MSFVYVCFVYIKLSTQLFKPSLVKQRKSKQSRLTTLQSHNIVGMFKQCFARFSVTGKKIEAE